MKTNKGTIHQIARCHDCGKSCEDYNRARKWAYQHAKSTGHRVLVEIGTFIKYN